MTKATQEQIEGTKKSLNLRMMLIDACPNLDVEYTRADMDTMKAFEELWKRSPDLPFSLYDQESSIIKAVKEITDDMQEMTGLPHKACVVMRDKDAEIPSFLVRVVPSVE